MDMRCWYEGPLAAFDLRATGADAETDRILSAAVVVQDTADGRPRATAWLVSPGVPVPATAAAEHGLSPEQVAARGRWPAPVVEETARELGAHSAAGRPLVVVDAPARLTLLDRELRRHRASSLSRYLAGAPLQVLDPRVLDLHLDPLREGPRTLTGLCTEYGTSLQDPQDTAARTFAALELVRAIGRRHSTRLDPLTPGELHMRQAAWHAAQARGGGTWFTPDAAGRAEDPAWPLRPELPAVA